VLRLEDDLGTRYVPGGGGGGGGATFRGEQEFTPTVPQSATELRVIGAEYPISVRL
jgi:hypothetical protein